MKIYGRKYSAKQLRRRVGNMDQIAGIRMVQLDNGNERPARAALFHTGDGFEFTVLTDRCMDIASASFQGCALGWRSTAGNVAPQYYEAAGLRWLRSYFGGLLTTCGLTNVGAPDPDSVNNGLGLHGRIGNMPARDLKVTQEWQGTEYVLRISGVMRQAVLFGENITMTRTISTKAGARSFRITDVIANEGFRKTPLQVLYHCNIGWPVLEEGAKIIAPSRHAAPRDSEAADGVEAWAVMDAPMCNYAEKVYYHDMRAGKDGMVTVALVNDSFNGGEGLGVAIRYNRDALPRFTEWKMMGEQDYVLGLEPCNCGVEGRTIDEERGLLRYLRPGEAVTCELEFHALSGKDALAAVRKQAAGGKTAIVESYRDFPGLQ
jgi:hypothetical protein